MTQYITQVRHFGRGSFYVFFVCRFSDLCYNLSDAGKTKEESGCIAPLSSKQIRSTWLS